MSIVHFLVLAAFLGKIEGLLAINFTPRFSTKCKIALLLSAFAFAPSVLSEVPVVTLSVENIQVRAEWRVVDDPANHFDMVGNTLMLRDNISAAGKPEGVTITAIVEVRDKFSSLNPNYEDLTVSIKITTVIMGCHAHWERNFAKSALYEGLVAVQVGNSIKVGDVIARRNTDNGYNNIFLHTVTHVHHDKENQGKNYISTSPNLRDSLSGYDREHPNVDVKIEKAWHVREVNGGGNCFDAEVEKFNIDKVNYEHINIHAPLISGFYAEKGRAVTVGTAFVYQGKQYFYLYNVTLAKALNESYTPKVIVDDGKAFSIDNKYQTGNYYEYVANLTVGSASVHGDKYNQPHQVTVVNYCPSVYETIVWKQQDSMVIDADDIFKVVKAGEYMMINGNVYTDFSASPAGTSTVVGHEGTSIFSLSAVGWDTSSLEGDYPIKFADHFLCSTE